MELVELEKINHHATHYNKYFVASFSLRSTLVFTMATPPTRGSCARVHAPLPRQSHQGRL